MTSFFIRARKLADRFRSGAAAFANEMHWRYLPPLMVYFAAGVSGFTGIIEAFFVKETLGLSAAMLASLGFWAGLPWAMKMPLGHLVDRFWHRKALFVYLGAGLMAASLLIMIGLTGHAAWMAAMLPLDTWYTAAVLLAPVGFVFQDVVADAMTVEAVPARRDDGGAYTEAEQQQMHVTMQTLGRVAIVGIAVIIFVFRAVPGVGAGSGWWQMDRLGFDEAFMGSLRQVSSLLAIGGMLALRGWMSRRPVPYLVVFLSLYGTVMTLPFLGMYYGLHEWTGAHLGFGARTIALIDTMADSPLGQVAMIPMLAWIAKEAPRSQKATYFAVMAAFTNLALSASQLGTKYLNRIFVVERGRYDELGLLMIVTMAIGLVLPVAAVWMFQRRASEPRHGPGARLKLLKAYFSG